MLNILLNLFTWSLVLLLSFIIMIFLLGGVLALTEWVFKKFIPWCKERHEQFKKVAKDIKTYGIQWKFIEKKILEWLTDYSAELVISIILLVGTIIIARFLYNFLSSLQ